MPSVRRRSFRGTSSPKPCRSWRTCSRRSPRRTTATFAYGMPRTSSASGASRGRRSSAAAPAGIASTRRSASTDGPPARCTSQPPAARGSTAPTRAPRDSRSPRRSASAAIGSRMPVSNEQSSPPGPAGPPRGASASSRRRSRASASMPRTRLPWRRSMSTMRGKALATDSRWTSPAKIPDTIGSRSVSTASAPMRRVPNSATVSSCPSRRAARNGSVATRRRPETESSGDARNAPGVVGTPTSAPSFNRKRFFASGAAASTRSASPRSTSRRRVAGSRSRKPFGPHSQRNPSVRSVRTFPPATLSPRAPSSRNHAPRGPRPWRAREIPPPTTATFTPRGGPGRAGGRARPSRSPRSTGVGGRMPCPRLKTWPSAAGAAEDVLARASRARRAAGAGRTDRGSPAPARRAPHARAAPSSGDAPVDADDVRAGVAHTLEERARPGAEQIDGHARGRDGLHHAARVGQRERLVVLRSRARPPRSRRSGWPARPRDLRHEVAGMAVGELSEQAMRERRGCW